MSKLRNKLYTDYKVDKPFDLGMQFHFRLNSDHSICGGDDLPMKDLDMDFLLSRLKILRNVGDLRVTEFSICGAAESEIE